MRLLRGVYRGLLYLYPASFRERFGEEMLWVFDEEARRGRALYVVADSLRAAVLRSAHSGKVVTAPYYCEIDGTLPVHRFMQAIFAVLCVLLVWSLLGPSGPGPKLIPLYRAAQPQGAWLLRQVAIPPASAERVVANPMLNAEISR